MAAPYSDNLYSGLDASDDEPDALSPSDGYFHASSSPPADHDAASSSSPLHQQPTDQVPGSHGRSASNVPSVPNILVEDPTLRLHDTAAAKAREAEQERLNNPDPSSPHQASPQASSQTSSQAPPQASSTLPSHPQASSGTSSQPHVSYPSISSTAALPASPSHHHRRSVEEDEPIRFERQPSPPRQQAAPSETSPLFRQQPVDAPPAYSPPVSSSPSSPQSSHSATGYQTFPPARDSMGRPEEHERLLARSPQSMGGPPENDPPSRWQRVKSSVTSTRARKLLSTILFISIFLSIFFALEGAFQFQKWPTMPGGGHKHSAPHSDMRWEPMRGCLNKPLDFPKISRSISFASDQPLSVVQTMAEKRDSDPRNGRWPNVYGEVNLKSVAEGAPGFVEVAYMTNHEGLEPTVIFEEASQEFRVEVPRSIPWSTTSLSPCVQMQITVGVPTPASSRAYGLQSLSVRAVHLNINVEEGFSVHAEEGVSLETTVGHVAVPFSSDKGTDPYSFNSRSTTIETVSGDIRGWFALYDLLRISSVSGDIKSEVSPKEVSNDRPKPATLEVSSVSGDISVLEPIERAIKTEKPSKNFPARDYVVKVSSTSGDITSKLAMTSRADFGTISGEIRAVLWPILDASAIMSGYLRPYVETDTKSGDTHLEILEPIYTGMVMPDDGFSNGALPAGGAKDPEWKEIRDNDPYLIIHPHSRPLPPVNTDSADRIHTEMDDGKKPVLSSLKSKHGSLSGDISLIYPASWEGMLYAETMSGSQHLRGEGLKLTRSSTFLNIVRGNKGEGHSEMRISSASGDEELLIGKET